MTDASSSPERAALQQTLGEAFLLEEELGGGGMSTVFRARDTELNRAVVIKLLPAELAAAVSVERFKREILVSAALQHPHIVPVLRAGDVGGLPYFVMPFIDGESLRTRLARGPLSVREAVGILKDVARALSYAHTNDVVHRDIKPDNIMLTGGSAVVTDFGVAKALTASRSSRRTGPISGAHAAAGDRLGHRHRHPRLHGTGTGRRRPEHRPSGRSLRPRCGGLGDADGHRTVPRPLAATGDGLPCGPRPRHRSPRAATMCRRPSPR